MSPTTSRLPVSQRQSQIPRPAFQPRAIPGKVFMRSELWKVWSQDEIASEAESLYPNFPHADDESSLPGFLDFEDANTKEDNLSLIQTESQDRGLSLEALINLREAIETDINFTDTVESLLTQSREATSGLGEETEEIQDESTPISSSSVSSSTETSSMPQDIQESGNVNASHTHDWDGSYVNPSPLWSPSLYHLPPAYNYHGTRLCECACSDSDSSSEGDFEDDFDDFEDDAYFEGQPQEDEFF
ncbi:hypothetical protein HYALB_00002679 [Hymenoscyphus albidus]|uniref:Uncharacterized protein n=1 Tax=Hymenoscyphus albidus TaxID=595503 RepID=A0A9N9LYA4_9HELO|nr:hypothetical protein HYALB_00002679 [Hymenoscyphus albidus]